MFEYVPFTHIEGNRKNKSLKLFSLSTCGFCRRAKAYLDSKEFEYQIIYTDELDIDIKGKIKKEFKEEFNDSIHFPTLVIDDKEFIVGFIRPDWEWLLEGKE